MAVLKGIIDNAVQGVMEQAKIPDPSVLAQAPNAATPSTTVAPSGIIGGAQSVPGMSAPPADTVGPKDYTKDIQDSYQKYLGRSGETAGVDFYNNLLKSGMSMDRINQGFTDSAEYKALHPAAKPASEGPTLLSSPTKWEITPDQTVQGQMKNLIDPNSPYYQQWATAGAQDAAARGFTGNSSIRSTGIMDSVMRGATPIATSDASTYAKAAGYNADMPNQFAMKNQDAANQMAVANLSADTQKAVAGMSAQTQRDVAALNNTSQATISQAHDANSALIASNDTAKSAYNSYVAAVAQIDQNEKLVVDPVTGFDPKREAIIRQTQIFNNAIAGLKAANSGTADVSSPLDITSANGSAADQVGGVDVSQILDFGG
jgi:hypothetical protein